LRRTPKPSALILPRTRYSPLTRPAVLISLIPVTIGNVIGGGGLVGAVYWFIYRRNRAPQQDA